VTCDPVDADEQLCEHIRTGGTPNPNDPLAQLLAGLRDDAEEAATTTEQHSTRAWKRRP
jgi:hypothetical protein